MPWRTASSAHSRNRRALPNPASPTRKIVPPLPSRARPTASWRTPVPAHARQLWETKPARSSATPNRQPYADDDGDGRIEGFSPGYSALARFAVAANRADDVVTCDGRKVKRGPMANGDLSRCPVRRRPARSRSSREQRKPLRPTRSETRRQIRAAAIARPATVRIFVVFIAFIMSSPCHVRRLSSGCVTTISTAMNADMGVTHPHSGGLAPMGNGRRRSPPCCGVKQWAKIAYARGRGAGRDLQAGGEDGTVTTGKGDLERGGIGLKHPRPDHPCRTTLSSPCSLTRCSWTPLALPFDGCDVSDWCDATGLDGRTFTRPWHL